MKALTRTQFIHWLNRLTPRKLPEVTVKPPPRRLKEPDIRLLISLLDVSLLTGNESHKEVETWCLLARKPLPRARRLHCAGVCVYPSYVSLVSKKLQGSGVRTIGATGAFPHAQVPLKLRLQEIAWCLAQGAEELDVPLNRSLFIEEGPYAVYSELLAIRRSAGRHTLKVILETGEMEDPLLLYQASLTSLLAGADFIKTSTGKGTKGATPEAFALMCLAVREFLMGIGRRAGVKPAGGIQKAPEALAYVEIARDLLGEETLTPQFFRVGASQLLKDLVARGH
ncbi:MAG: deoxyribose-phosphate aldolase [Fimbriimonadales bacterium]|nr:deoxyribose-phosphate aldolase [Fimbriimonadales bacterium]